MLGNHGRGLTKALFTRPALALGRLGVTPNMLTVTGTALSVTAAVTLLPKGHFVTGPLVLLVVLVADSFDGILARATGKSSVFGAFLDSTMDRLADGAVLGSLAAWAALSMPAGVLRTVTVVAALAAASRRPPFPMPERGRVHRCHRLRGDRRAHRPAPRSARRHLHRGARGPSVGAHHRAPLRGGRLLHHRDPTRAHRPPAVPAGG